MTHHHSGYVLVLENNISEDAGQKTIETLKQIKGVLDVVPVDGDVMTAIATTRAKHDLLDRLYTFLHTLRG